jgi:lysophospholipase L1-like esterase
MKKISPTAFLFFLGPLFLFAQPDIILTDFGNILPPAPRNNLSKPTLQAASDNSIQVHAATGPNNTYTYGFYYMGAIKLLYESDEPVLPASLSLIAPNGGEYWQSGKEVKIRWESINVGQALLEYSIDEGASWNTISTVAANSEQYSWNVPDEVSTQCLLRISADALLDVSDGRFEITDDTTSCSIVVLGSSTAAGVGPSVADSAWVNRFYDVLYQKDTRFVVTNLARGGYTTFHLLPDDALIPDNINVTIDSARNISAALSYDPYAIIVNLPSNDAANDFTVSQQMDNFKQITKRAAQAGVLSWVCTTQPRNFNRPLQIEIQENARDSIYAIYGDFAIDFWSEIADPNSLIANQYDSGDGIHLNDRGHRILTQRVLEKRIDTLCPAELISTDGTALALDKQEAEILTASQLRMCEKLTKLFFRLVR